LGGVRFKVSIHMLFNAAKGPSHDNDDGKRASHRFDRVRAPFPSGRCQPFIRICTVLSIPVMTANAGLR